jgi:hypothetical protein
MDRGAAAWSSRLRISGFQRRSPGIAALLALASCTSSVELGGGQPDPDGGTRVDATSTTSGAGGEGVGATTAASTGSGGAAPDPGGPSIHLAPGSRLLAGADNTCVLSAAGHVACWGSNENGQLGVGDLVDRRTPTWIPGLDGVVELAVGGFAMCARKGDGAVRCWGMNFYGELGVKTPDCPAQGPAPCSAVPVDTGLVGATLIGPGVHNFCAALGPKGDLACWGAPDWWKAPGYHPLSTVGGDGFTCVRFAPGPGQDPTRNVVCAGDNSTGQLGSGFLAGNDPGPIAGGVAGGFVEIAAGLNSACGVGAGNQLYCWGNNLYGQLGVGLSDTMDYPESCASNGACTRHPIQVPGLPPIAHVASQWTQTCAVTTAGEAYCWGSPSHTSPASASACSGANPECVPTPLLVPGVAQATAIAVGNGHACALTSSGEVRCWGLDTHGQLGRGPGASFETTPVLVKIPKEPG